MSTASLRPVFAALHTVEASEVTQRSSRESKAASKRYLRIQLSSTGSGSEKRSTVSAWLWTIRVCLRSSRRFALYGFSLIQQLAIELANSYKVQRKVLTRDADAVESEGWLTVYDL